MQYADSLHNFTRAEQDSFQKNYIAFKYVTFWKTSIFQKPIHCKQVQLWILLLLSSLDSEKSAYL